MRQQPALALQPPGIALERAILADDAVARHDEGDGVGRVGAADGARGLAVVMPQLPRQRAVAGDLAGRNPAQRLPDPLLQRAAAGGGGNAVQRVALPREVVRQRRGDGRRGRRLAQSVCPVVQVQQNS